MIKPDISHLNWYGRWQTAFHAGLPEKFAQLFRRWLRQQRWFLEKQEKLLEIRLYSAIPVTIENRHVWWLLLSCHSSAGQRMYQVPIVLLPESGNAVLIARLGGTEAGWLVDAWSWPPLANWALKVMAGKIEHEALVSWSSGTIDPGIDAQLLHREQSNTAIRFGDRYFLKALRFIGSGTQPDEEMGKELADRGFAHSIPCMAGMSVKNKEPINLALLFPYQANLGNGWDWYQEAIARLVSLSAEQRQEEENQLLASSKLLGKRTKELHTCLSQPSADAAFAPEVFNANGYHQLVSRITGLYQGVCRKLKQGAGRIASLKPMVSQLASMRSVVNGLGAVATSSSDGLQHRVHGDYHLGQVLRTEDDWLIIDFEGQPLQTLLERRRKDLPWRDVAGMLRSFAYLAAMFKPQSVDQALWKSRFFRQLRVAFVAGYHAAGQSGPDQVTLHFLKLYELEKALYEIEYELAARPTWLGIPLCGAVELLGTWNDTSKL